MGTVWGMVAVSRDRVGGGDWYMLNTRVGRERRACDNLLGLDASRGTGATIFEVVVPSDGGGGGEPLFPGYVMARLADDEATFRLVLRTSEVTAFTGCFLGRGDKPVPLSRRDVRKMLGGVGVPVTSKPREGVAPWSRGEVVEVRSGPFAGYSGVVESVNVGQGRLVALVEVFGRDTPLELEFGDVSG